MSGLAPQTSEVFERITCLECIKSFVLVGGTALSLQLNKRQSEDLDFMKWLTKRNEKPEVAWPTIKKELESVGEIREYSARLRCHALRYPRVHQAETIGSKGLTVPCSSLPVATC